MYRVQIVLLNQLALERAARDRIIGRYILAGKEFIGNIDAMP